MTVNDILTKTDGMFPNQYTTAQKLSWFNDVERNIFNYMYPGVPYSTKTATSVPYANDEMIYVNYIAAMIDYANEEIDRYNNKAMAFEMRFQAWKEQYTQKGYVKQPVRVRNL